MTEQLKDFSILIVDDEEHICENLAETVQMVVKGVQVHIAHTLSDAIKIFDQENGNFMAIFVDGNFKDGEGDIPSDLGHGISGQKFVNHIRGKEFPLDAIAVCSSDEAMNEMAEKQGIRTISKTMFNLIHVIQFVKERVQKLMN